MPVIGIAEVLVKPVFTGAQQSIGREMDGIADDAGERAGKSSGSKMGAALGGALKVGALAVGGAAIAGIGVALTKGFGRLQAIENAKAKLTGLGHDIESVTGIMNDAMAAVKGTAFGLDEASTIAAGAVAAGIKPGKELERTLRLTADAATIAGVEMSDMGGIFNGVATSNKIQGDTIAQLSDAGIPIVQLLAKELGKTAEETVNLASEGKINFETFQRAMESGLGGAALESGKTLEGAFKNTMAAVGRIGASLLSGVYPKIQQFFAGAIDWLKPLEEGAKIAGAAIGIFLDNAIVGAQGLYDLIVKGDYTGKLQQAFGWAEDSPFVDFLLTAREASVKLRDAIKDFGSYIKTDIIPALESMGQWVKDNKDWLEALAVGVGAAVAAFKIYTTTLAIHAAVTGGLAAAQTALAWTAVVASIAMYNLNAAMKANLIGIIVLAVVALVSGLIWFFTQTETGKDIVKNVWAFIQSVISGVVDWFTNTALPAIQAFIGGIGDVLNWLYENIVKPVFAGIGAAVTSAGGFFNWLWVSVIKPVFDAIGVAVRVVGDVFNWLWINIFQPVFSSIGVIVGGFYLLFRGIFQLIASVIENIVIPMIKMLWDRFVEGLNGIGAVFTWLYESIIKPVFDAIGAVIGWVWVNVIKATFDAWIYLFQNVLAPAFVWLYESIIKPVFDAIGAVIGWVWDNILKPIFDTWVWVFQNVIGPVFTWLYENVIKPAFDGIGSAISWVWENVIKPVFDALGGFMTKTIPDAFNAGVGFIKTAWDKLIEIAKMPVKFVIDTVINDGLIGAFNTVAGILPGIDKLPRVALPAGFAQGGILPGQSSWRNGDDQLVPMRRGEGVLMSEVMSDPYERARLYAMNKAAVMGRKASEARALFGEGFAKGGIVNPLKQMAETQGYNRIHKGVDLAASVGTPVYATEGGRVSWSGPGVQAPGVWGGNEVHIDGGSGIQSWFAHLSSMAVKVGDMVRAGQQVALSGNTGISSGPHLHFGAFAGGWPNDINPYGYLGTAGVPSGGGFNPLAGIIDGLLASFKSTFPAAGFMADIAIGIGKKLFGSISDLITGGQGSATGDPALYDLGGILPPGISQVVNRTGKPEAILNPQQWADISRIAARAGDGADAAALDRLTDAVTRARPITVQQMSSTQAQVNALARAMEGV